MDRDTEMREKEVALLAWHAALAQVSALSATLLEKREGALHNLREYFNMKHIVTELS